MSILKLFLTVLKDVKVTDVDLDLDSVFNLMAIKFLILARTFSDNL